MQQDNKWHLKLQLHGEDAADAGAVSSTAPEKTAPPAAAAESAETVQNAGVQAASGADAAPAAEEEVTFASEKTFGLVKGPDGRMELKVLFGKQPEEQEKDAPEAAEQPSEQPEAAEGTTIAEEAEKHAETIAAPAEPYSLNEFTEALKRGDIDERRVPEEYKGQYANFKIQQAVQEYNKQQETQTQQKAEVEKQLSPEEKKQAMKDFYVKLEENAKARALNELGLDESRLANLEFEDGGPALMQAYTAAKEWHRQQIISDIQQQANQQAQLQQTQQSVYQGIVDFVKDAKTKEPNFDAIDRMMQTRYMDMPYGKARPVEEAINALKTGNITEQQAVVMREYYESCRKEYYAKANNISTVPKPAPKAPPVVENGAGLGEQKKNSAPDYAALRNAKGMREKTEWLKNFLFGNAR